MNSDLPSVYDKSPFTTLSNNETKSLRYLRLKDYKSGKKLQCPAPGAPPMQSSMGTPFGQAQPSTQPLAFGAPRTSAFGAPAQPSAFGGASTGSSFGAPAQQTSSFGASSSAFGGSSFGSAAPQSSFGGASSFGSSQLPAAAPLSSGPSIMGASTVNIPSASLVNLAFDHKLPEKTEEKKADEIKPATQEPARATEKKPMLLTKREFISRERPAEVQEKKQDEIYGILEPHFIGPRKQESTR